MCAKFSVDQTTFFTGSADGKVRLWDTTGVLIRTFSGHAGSITSVGFSSDGARMVTGAQDFTAKLWDVATGSLVRTFSGHTGSPIKAVISPDGSKVLTGSADKRLDSGTPPRARQYAPLPVIPVL